MAARKKATRKKTAAKKATAASSSWFDRSTKARKSSAQKARSTAKRKAAPEPSAEQRLADKIVRMTEAPETMIISELYSPECSSQEPGDEPQQGLSAIEEKFRRFEEAIRSQRWTARNVCISNAVICIEWQAELEMIDARQVKFAEVAVHEVSNGKIIAERFYYDPNVLAPAIDQQAEPQPPGPPPEPPKLSDGPPPIDPIDL